MSIYLSLVLLIFAIGLAVSSGLTVILFRRRKTAGAPGLFGLVLAAGIWIICDGLRQLTASPDLENVLNRLAYLGIAPVPLFWLTFAFDYSGRERLLRRLLPLLLAVSALTVALAWTNSLHHLIWRSYELTRVNGLLTMKASYGPCFWVFWVYTEACLAVGSYLLLGVSMRTFREYRGQALSVLIGVAIPWVVNIKYVLRIPPLADFDWSPISFAFSGVFLSYSVIRHRLFDLIPVAFDHVVHGMRDGVVVADALGRIVEWNPAAAGQFSLTRAGVPLGEAIPAMAGSTGAEEDSRQIAAGQQFYSVSSRTIDSSRHGGCVYVFHDITSQLATEQMLRELKEKAEAASAAKSEFLAMMTHELRTPLNAVIGTADLLGETAADEEQREGLDTIRKAGETLLSLVNDILDLSKLEALEVQLVDEVYGLRSVLADSLEMVSEAARRKTLSLEIQIASEVPDRLLGDSSRLKQILLNLLGNAVKFTERGGILLRVDCDEPETLRISVQDTGQGIAEHKLGILFQPFVQADVSRTRRHEGTGLGLVISKRLVERMGGTVMVTSVEGVGSTFLIRIPLRISTGELPLIPDALWRSTIEHAGGRSSRILLAEDNLVNQQVASKMLRKLGYQVDIANNGLDAVAAWKREKHSLVLMDCRMPEMDGFEATRAIRAEEGGDKAVIIALTADVFSDAKGRCMDAGMNDYLSKPVHWQQLANALDKWLRTE